MSLHWNIIAGFLFGEIAATLLLLIPCISSKIWNKLFKSRFFKGLEEQLIYYFYILVTILVLFFLDAVREMSKYSDNHQEDNGHTHGHEHLDVHMNHQMRLFRAQRNFYISGFALFLCLVIKRLVLLLSANACVDAEKTAAIKQAQSASNVAEELLKGGEGDDKMKEKLKEKTEELIKALKDVAAMKAQAENLSSEYNRLCEEKISLESRLAIQGGGDKKED